MEINDTPNHIKNISKNLLADVMKVMQEGKAPKKAVADFDGDGVVETPHREHNGVKRNRIAAAYAAKLQREESEQIGESLTAWSGKGLLSKMRKANADYKEKAANPKEMEKDVPSKKEVCEEEQVELSTEEIESIEAKLAEMDEALNPMADSTSTNPDKTFAAKVVAQNNANKADAMKSAAPTPKPTPTTPAYPVRVPIKEEESAYDDLQEAMDANSRYDHHFNLIKGLLKSIGEHVDNHKKEAKAYKGSYGAKDGVNWGHVGDLDSLSDRLGDIHDQLARENEYKKSPLREDTEAPKETIEEAAPIRKLSLMSTVRGVTTGTMSNHRQQQIQKQIIDEAKAGRQPDTGNEPKYHILSQLEKAAKSMTGTHNVWFKDGNKGDVAGTTAAKLITAYRNLDRPADKEEMQKRIWKSHKDLHDEASKC